MNNINGYAHKSYTGLLGSLQRENRRDKSLLQKVYSSGFYDQQSKRKPFQHDNSQPKPCTGQPKRQKSQVVQKLRKVIMQKKMIQKENSVQQINLVQKLIYNCKNFTNSCSRLIKSYTDVIDKQDPLVKTVLSNRLQLSRIVNDIQKSNLMNIEQQHQQLKEMVIKLQKSTKLQPTIYKQSFDLGKKILKQMFELKQCLDFERLIETSGRQIKIRGILADKNLHVNSYKKFTQLMETAQYQKNQIFNSLMSVVNGTNSLLDKDGINKKIKQILTCLKVQINDGTTSLKLLQLIENKTTTLVEINLLNTLQIKKIKSELQTKSQQLERKNKQINIKSSHINNIQRDNRRFQQELTYLTNIQVSYNLNRLKQPQFNYQRIQQLQKSNKLLQSKVNKQYNELRKLCDNHQVKVENEQDMSYQIMLDCLDVWIVLKSSQIMQIEKQNIITQRKIDDLQEQFENVIRAKLRYQQQIQKLKNSSLENSYKQKLQVQRKKSKNDKNALNKLRQQYSMIICDLEGQIIRLNSKVKQYQTDIFSLQGKVKVRDEINQQIMQQKSTIQQELQNKLELTGSLQLSSMKLRRQKEEINQKFEKLFDECEQDKNIIKKLTHTIEELEISKSELLKTVEQQTNTKKNQKQQFDAIITKLKEQNNNIKLQITKYINKNKQMKSSLQVINSQIKQLLSHQNQIVLFLSSQFQQLVQEVKKQIQNQISVSSKISSQLNQSISNISSLFAFKLNQISQKIEIISLKINKKLVINNNSQSTQTQQTTSFVDTEINTQPLVIIQQQTISQKVQKIEQQINTSNQNIGYQFALKVIQQLKKQNDMLLQETKRQINDFRYFFNILISQISEAIMKQQSKILNVKQFLEFKFKIDSQKTMEEIIKILGQQNKQQKYYQLSPYYQTLEKMVEELLYNKVNLNLQQQIKALPQQERQKINMHKKKIGWLQNQLTGRDELNQKVNDLNKQIEVLKSQQINLEKKLKYYEQDINQKQTIIQQLKSNNKQILNFIEIPNQTLSLIGQQQDNSQIQFYQVALSDLLDQSGICNDQLQFTKCELSKTIKQLCVVKNKFRLLDKNNRQVINYLKLSIINMIESIQNSKDAPATLKHLLEELKVCKGNIK